MSNSPTPLTSPPTNRPPKKVSKQPLLRISFNRASFRNKFLKGALVNLSGGVIVDCEGKCFDTKEKMKILFFNFI